ncbi:MAG: response regulator [Bacteroidia bacterium]
MRPFRIFIVEDEFIIAENLRMILESLGYDVPEPCGSMEDALKRIPLERPDLCILDINLHGKHDGIELGKKLQEELNVPFVYLTSNADPETVKQAGVTKPLAYLVKPFNADEIYAAIEIALIQSGILLEQRQSLSVEAILPESFFIRVGNRYVRMEISDIVYIKSEGKYLEIFGRDQQRLLVRQSMESMLEQLKERNFVRVHRSYAINLKYLMEISTDMVKVDQFEVPVGRVYREDMMRRIQTML